MVRSDDGWIVVHLSPLNRVDLETGRNDAGTAITAAGDERHDAGRSGYWAEVRGW